MNNPFKEIKGKSIVPVLLYLINEWYMWHYRVLGYSMENTLIPVMCINVT